MRMERRVVWLSFVVFIGLACDESGQTDYGQGQYYAPVYGPDAACVGGGQQAICNGFCTDLLSDVNNCGSCGRICNVTETCSNGWCVAAAPVCAYGQTPCGSQCVDIGSDRANCGACFAACPQAQNCVAGTCVCPGGGQLCAESCVDTLTSNEHCGACNTPCPIDQTCVQGQCVCPNNQMLCGGSCVDTATSALHCGNCNNPCVRGRTCQTGNCACPNGTQICNDACVDLNADAANCGACGVVCTGGEVCLGGQCQCDVGSVKCEDQCRDITADPQNCGDCDHSCYAGENCEAGLCRGPIAADGCNGSVRNLTITEVAAYQAVKIPLSSGLNEIPSSSRVADIVEERDTLFRIFIRPESGWIPTEVSARVTVTNNGNDDQYFEKKRISGISNDAQADSTFQINVPADKIKADTLYSIELVACVQSTDDTSANPRFPASGSASLSPIRTGVLKVHFVPISYNGFEPDTSETTLAIYRKTLEAMYPITRAEFTVGSQISFSGGFSGPVSSTSLDQVRYLRQTDNPASDIYYFGLIKPAQDLVSYCGRSCTLGISYVAGVRDAAIRVGVGAAFGDVSSSVTIAHELGHSHGREHAPCAPGGMIDSVDPNYPYPNALVGVWGYSSRSDTFVDPMEAKDIMGYCSPYWISDYTYNALAARVSTLNTTRLELLAATVQMAWRVMLLDEQGPRWGLPFSRPAEPYGQPEELAVLDAQGVIIQYVTGYRTPISGPEEAAMLLVPEPESGWYAVQAKGWLPLEFAAPVSVPMP